MNHLILLTILLSPPFALGLKCYHCNSVNDANCEDPFDPDNAGSLLKDCSTINLATGASGATLDDGAYFCRKTSQRTNLRKMKEESYRVVRTCGFKNDTRLMPNEGESPNALKCYRRAGTFETESTYCGCYQDGCNPATRPFPGFIQSIALFSLTTAFARILIN